MPRKSSTEGRAGIIKSITTPLGFYVLILLIVEATVAIVLTYSKLSEDHVWQGLLWMLGGFALILVVVTVLVIWNPKHLLFGKEEHANPALDPSALRDQIEDIIASRVRPECLNPPKD